MLTGSRHYKVANGTLAMLRYHLVWSTRRRRPVGVGGAAGTSVESSGAVAVASSSVNVAPRSRPSLAPFSVPPWASTIERLIVRPNPNPPAWKAAAP